MRSQEIKKFIEEHQHLFWYTPAKEKENISDELLLEHILNYADLMTIKRLFALMGIEKVKAIFQNFKGSKKGNIYPEIYHLFSEYLKRN
jgi:hypothetical protein